MPTPAQSHCAIADKLITQACPQLKLQGSQAESSVSLQLRAACRESSNTHSSAALLPKLSAKLPPLPVRGLAFYFWFFNHPIISQGGWETVTLSVHLENCTVPPGFPHPQQQLKQSFANTTRTHNAPRVMNPCYNPRGLLSLHLSREHIQSWDTSLTIR